MGKIVEKKKKKGRPSLLDIQKRTLREQQQQYQNQTNPNLNSNPNSSKNSFSPNQNNRRFTRQNPNSEEEEEDNNILHDQDDSNKKKFKVVVKLRNSQALSNGDDAISIKKRKINEVGGGSVNEDIKKEEKLNLASRASDSGGMEFESGPTTPLPDKKLLVFILDRLQKKDTYGVYSEPVDPKELPDYHEYVDHPMDFGTVRKKLASGAYANLEQFENDVFLISSNAMKYNAPDTIYYRQARSIQELARKDFENLRQESDDNQSQPKVVRRGRPPTKHLKKRLGRPPIERLSSDFSSNATLANGGDNNNCYDLRRGPFSGKYSPADVSGWGYHGSEANDDYSGFSMKYGKKNIVLDENRRNSYKQSHQVSSDRSTSVLATFDGEKKQLMAVGLHMEHGFARSLARFAATLGPVAWKMASKRIERALPPGVKFGPGWVGECEAPSSLLSLPIRGPAHIWPQQPFSCPKTSSLTTAGSTLDVETDELQDKQGSLNNSASDAHFNKSNFQSTVVSSSSLVGDISHDRTIEQRESTGGLSNESVIHPNRPFQIHQVSAHKPPMNGFIGGFQNPSSQMDNLVRPAVPVGDATSTVLAHSEIQDRVVRTSNNFVQPWCYKRVELEAAKLSVNTINSDTALAGPIAEMQGRTSVGLQQSPLQESPEHQISDTVPPDLNLRFQSSGSPNSTQ